MNETFLYSARAILPILLTILLGYVVRRIGPWTDTFYKMLNQLCFRLFLPIYLFCSVYSVENLSSVNWAVLAYLAGSILFCLVLGLLCSRLFIRRRDQRGVITQVTFRSNQAILGIPLADALGGEPSLAFASLSTAVCVPMYNILAVLVLTLFGGKEDHKISARALLWRIVSNPLILGCFSGMLVVAIRQFIPAVDGIPVFMLRNQLPSLFQALTNISRVASPIMLFVLGTRLDFSAVPGLLPQLCLGVVLRLVVCPALVLGAAVLLREPLGLTVLEMPSLVAITASPVAVSSALMTQELGGDEQLANQLVIWTSILSMLTIFCIVYLMRSHGLL